jgi:hypothetical protein
MMTDVMAETHAINAFNLISLVIYLVKSWVEIGGIATD